MRASVFFERDGILNLVGADSNRRQSSPRTVDEFVINEAALTPLQLLKSAGFLLIATTNQPGISRGYISRREVDLMHELLFRKFPLDDLFMCPHDEMDRCPCRKPKPGLLREAGFKWKINFDLSFVVSETWQDAKAAHSASCRSLLIASPLNGAGHHDCVLPSLPAAAAKIIRMQNALMMAPC